MVNMKSLGLVVSEKQIFEILILKTLFGASRPCCAVDQKIWHSLVGVHQVILHAKYLSPSYGGYTEDFLKFSLYNIM